MTPHRPVSAAVSPAEPPEAEPVRHWPWRNLPAKPVEQTSGGICGMHGLFVGRVCPKCVTQPKGLS